MSAITICSDFGAPQNKVSHCFHCFPIYLPGNDFLELQGVQTNKGNQFWIFIGRTNVEAETTILWPPHVKNWVIRKDPDAGKDWKQEEKETTEDEMIGWYNQLDGHEYEQVGDIPGSLVCCSPWGCKESNTTEQINWTDFLKSPVYI